MPLGERFGLGMRDSRFTPVIAAILLTSALFSPGCSDDDSFRDPDVGVIERMVRDLEGNPIANASICFALTLESELVEEVPDHKFSPSAMMSVRDLDQGRHVSVNVYSPDGSLVLTTYDGPVSELPNSIAWDGRLESGRRAPINVYRFEFILSELNGEDLVEVSRLTGQSFLRWLAWDELYEAYHVQTDSEGRFRYEAEEQLAFGQDLLIVDLEGEVTGEDRISRRVHVHAIAGDGIGYTGVSSKWVEFPVNGHLELEFLVNTGS